MLTENDSHYLLQECIQAVRNEDSFNIVKGMGAKFGVDGNQYYYGFGELSEQNSVYGFGKTPSEALQNFSVAFYSQTIKTTLQ